MPAVFLACPSISKLCMHACSCYIMAARCSECDPDRSRADLDAANTESGGAVASAFSHAHAQCCKVGPLAAPNTLRGQWRTRAALSTPDARRCPKPLASVASSCDSWLCRPALHAASVCACTGLSESKAQVTRPFKIVYIWASHTVTTTPVSDVPAPASKALVPARNQVRKCGA